nr:prealbumin-like fold domain-containing protein [Clostridium perfringens]
MNKDNVTVSWTGLNVAVQVIKKGDDGKLLAGVEFNLEDTNGKVIATQKSDKDGKVVFSALKEGN